MSDIAKRIAALSPEKQALLAQKLKAETTAKGAEPLAIVGIGCRFPGGADDPEALWRLLAEKRDAVTEVPADRWDADALFDPKQLRSGTMTSRWGSWLPRLDEFDAQFFSVAPREAARTDPQQRLLLEVAYEALEDAGQTLEGLAGSRTGVYVGTHTNDYSWMVFGDVQGLDAYASTGTSHSIAANRLSYVWDLRGPSIAVDTACSASLVAVHLACQALRQRECDLAVAGGINLILSPLWSIALSKLPGMLSPTGRCRTFDASADGIVRGEGCGMVALKRLADAVATGDRIWAVVRGTATNQDGRTNGITAPNGLSQQAVLRSALDNAGLTGDTISAVEAHGTGTILGDPIEVEALAEVIGHGKAEDNPCLLGSIKTNIGHLEGAAGVAGLIKLALSLHHERWPALVHFESLNPHIPTAGTRFVFPREERPWTRGSVPRRAGVSAFGFGGANAHVILEEAPVSTASPRPREPSFHVLPLSAHTDDALKERAGDFASFLDGAGRGASIEDIAFTAARRRSRLEYGVSVAGRTREELIERLQAIGAGAVSRGTARVRRNAGRPGGLVFVFSGQGSQWARMLADVERTEPTIAAALSECDALVRNHGGWSLLEELRRPPGDSRLEATQFAQPAIFAAQIALVRWFAEAGLTPEAVLGHSVGEVAAAHVAGMLDLKDAVDVVVRRARLMQAATGAGRMLAVEGGDGVFADIVEGSGGALSWAAYNSPTSRVLSGDRTATEAAAARLESRGATCKWLPVDYAFHSTQMEPHAAALAAELQGLVPRTANLPFVSTVDGSVMSRAGAGAEYWGRNVRQPVRFAAAVEAAVALGSRHFVEIGPHAVLGRSLRQCLDGASVDGAVLGTLQRGDSDAVALYSSVGALALLGHEPHWDKLHGSSGRVVTLPAYPWQRQKYPLPRPRANAPLDLAEGAAGLLGSRLATAVDTFESGLSLEDGVWFEDHVIHGQPILPAAGFLCMASEAALRVFGPGDHAIEDLVVGESLRLRAKENRQLQIACVRESADIATLRAFSRPAQGGGAWIPHASARLVRRSSDARVEPPASRVGGALVSATVHYEGLAQRGAAFGSAYRTVEGLQVGPDFVSARVAGRLSTDDAGAAPAILDGALQAASSLAHSPADGGQLQIPFSVARATVRAFLPAQTRVEVRRSEGGPSLDIVGFDEAGAAVFRLEGLRFRASQAAAPDPSASVTLHAVAWREAPLAADSPRSSGEGVIVVDRNAPLPVAGLDAVVYLATLTADLSASSRSAEGPDTDTDTKALLAVVRELVSQPKPPRLVVLTRGARAVHDREVPDLASAPLLGLAQVIGLEHPDLRVVSVDLDPASSDDGPLAVELAQNDGEEAVAIRRGRRYVARLTPRNEPPPMPAPRRLVKGATAVIDAMGFVHLDRRPPGPGEVELEVLTAGVNFRDVLSVLGMYPGEPVPLGNECAGRVVAVGAGVAHLAVGDIAMGVAMGSLASHVVVDARLQMRKPPAMPLLDAAATPIAYLTAYYAMSHMAGLKASDRVLIHAAAGGVGLAAVALARQAGATVYATAGSEEKRAFLRSRGVEHVFDSRTVGFAEEIKTATRGAGVDMVLNSLVGDFIAKSFDVLAPSGRFLEIGKRGIWTHEQARTARPDVAYHVVYLGGVCEDDPELVHEHLLRIVGMLDSGALTPLPVQAWEADEAHDAFRYMAQARHIGKLVLTFDSTPPPATLRDDAAYVITGGLGGLGLVIAEDLVSRGARNLALLGRSVPGAAAHDAIARLQEAGARVRAVSVDVSDATALEHALADIEKDLAPVAGIVHAAGVLDDGPIASQEWGRFARVFAPKVRGAWNLHRWSLGRSIDFFSLFSSAASLVGWPGQGSYAAANAFLDNLAHYRRGLGLPAQSLNWGAWKDVGMAASLGAHDQDRMRRFGMGALSPVQGAAAFVRAAHVREAQVAPLIMDFAAFASTGGTHRVRRFLSDVLRSSSVPSSAAEAQADQGIRRELAQTPKARRRGVVLARVKAQTLRTLGLPNDFPLDARRGLRDLGLDSLMAVELRNALQQLVGMTLPPTLLFDYPTVETLTNHLASLLAPQGVGAAAKVAEPRDDTPLGPRNGDDDAEAALRAELAALRGEREAGK